MDQRLNILYRGPLSSCNYRCPYCPFAKRRESAAELNQDRVCLNRFMDWIENDERRSVQRRYGILFTPWGEALTRRWYRDGMVRLSHSPQVDRVVVQTNLSVPLDWIASADRNKLALWCTYHPGEVTRESFLKQCRQLDEIRVRYSVGVVGLKEHADEIAGLRDQLDPAVYLWINAYKRDPDYYEDGLLRMFTSVDPLFPLNNTRHLSFGRSCRAGQSAISVDGVGNVRRCHFIKEILGNLYTDDLDELLKPRLCTNATCGCHIGYVHLQHLKLNETFGNNVLERIPQRGSGSLPFA